MITPLQFLILKIVRKEYVLGSDIRKRLKETNSTLFNASYYKIMSRMKKEGLVVEREMYKGDVPNKMYKISAKGEEQLKETAEFYKLTK